MSHANFLQAISLWTGNEDNLRKQGADLFGQFERLWQQGPCAVLQYAQACDGRLTDADCMQLAKLCESDLTARAEFLLTQIGLSPSRVRLTEEGASTHNKSDDFVEQLVQLTQGYAHAVLAAHELRIATWTANRANQTPKSLPPEFIGHASAAMQAFHAAWPIAIGGKVVSAGGSHFQSNAPDAHGKSSFSALDALLRESPSSAVDNSAWLTVRRLLGYILDGESSSEQSQSASVLTVDHLGTGRCGKVELSRTAEGQFGFYLDPVFTNTLLFDRPLIESLTLGWRCCRDALRQQIKDNTRLSLRLTPRVDSLLLRGGSAGGMLALAMFATASDTQLNDDMAASFALSLEQGANEEHSQPLERHQVRLRPVSETSVQPKILAAILAGKKQVLFSAEQRLKANGPPLEDWRTDFCEQIEIIGVRTLEEAYGLMTGNSRLERILQAYAKATADEWERERPERFIEPHYARLVDERELIDSTEQLRRGPNDKAPDHRQPLLDEETRAGITLRPGHQEQIGDRELTQLIQLALDERRGPSTTRTQTKEIQAKETQSKDKSAPGFRLILAEDANAGKTVFTKRLKYFFADSAEHAGLAKFFDRKPVLVFRWENRVDSVHWPTGSSAADAETNLRRDLEVAVAPFCDRNQATPHEVVEYAVSSGRVVLIFDAADQAGDPEQLIHALAMFPDWRRCHVVVTGRSFRFSQDDGPRLFPRAAWTLTTLLGFDDNQKARYLNDVLPAELRSRRADPLIAGREYQSLFASYDDVVELLEVPGMIQMARELIQEERQRLGSLFVRLTRLRTRCDFYWEYYRKKLIGEAVRERSGLNVASHGERWQMMLAVTAFRMVLARLTGYSARGNLLVAIKRDVIEYCKKFDGQLSWTGNDDPSGHWQAVAQFSALSDHGALEPHSSTDSLSWRHKGWMEFFLGLFFAKYARADALREFDFDEIHPDVSNDDRERPGFQAFAEMPTDNASLYRAVLTQLTNDPQWYWGWRIATEIPRVPVDAGNKPPFHSRLLAQSLGTLFLVPARGIRPTKLMYYAFYLFEQDDVTPDELRPFGNRLIGTEAVLCEFRRPFQELLDPVDDETKLPLEVRRKREVAKQMKESFKPCPPQAWIDRFEARQVDHAQQGKRLTDEHLWDADPCAFWQGSPADVGRDNERPRHHVRLRPFAMQQTTVTRSQFRLFDERFENSSDKTAWGGDFHETIDKYSSDDQKQKIKEDDCPIIMVSWFHAFVFTKFLGPEFRLPTEAEWEFACRAGKDGPDDLYHFGKTLTAKQANLGMKIGRPIPMDHKTYPKHAFELDQMHGNLWEWCQDWYNRDYYESVSQQQELIRDPLGPDAGSHRVMRGGSFDEIARNCRAAVRAGIAPDARRRFIGFRLVFRESCVPIRPKFERVSSLL
jgi:formylglycine-generating enzyme required for sulfatase activity